MMHKDQMDVDHLGGDDREILLYVGDVFDVVADDPVDFFLVTCKLGDYSDSLANEVVYGLYRRNISVAELARRPAMDFRPFLPCWISQPIPDELNIGFRRLVVFEPEDTREDAAEQAWKAYQALRLFSGADASKTLAVHVAESKEWVSILLRMNFFAAASLGARVPWRATKLIAQNRVEETVVDEFALLKERYIRPPVGFDSELNAVVDSIASECAIPSVSVDIARAAQELNLTERQYRAIQGYTLSDYTPLNTVLRSCKVTDPRYALNHAAIEAINTGLSLLGNYSDEEPVHRALNWFEGIEERYSDGEISRELSFTSTTIVSFGGGGPGEYRLAIQSSIGKYIAPISVFPGEEEVLFESDMWHLVTDKEVETIGEKEITTYRSAQVLYNSTNIDSLHL
ncbi:ADP-ribosyltransferase [Pseudomonas akapageensis]|uniref:ADP-ribosyltransferase n=1 Tax=Pseudomonas akapageensis TaxID=2609961 RepID=UPI0014073CA3|nr:ADP-ribosyltransferase [Pseudomonas akapageensis]